VAGNKPILVERVTVTTDGVTHEGAYYVNGSILHVRSPFGAKATEVGGSPPKAIAELLLSEIVSDREGEGEIA
jgi:hypothetical protein